MCRLKFGPNHNTVPYKSPLISSVTINISQSGCNSNSKVLIEYLAGSASDNVPVKFCYRFFVYLT